MEATNAKFSITTKEGRSVTKEFTSYKEADRYAKEKYGPGCIVQVVGNSVNSSNSVVANAIAANAPSYLSMDKDIGKAKVYLEHFRHQGKATRFDDYEVDRLKAFFVNMGCEEKYLECLKNLKANKPYSFEVRPVLKARVVPM